MKFKYALIKIEDKQTINSIVNGMTTDLNVVIHYDVQFVVLENVVPGYFNNLISNTFNIAYEKIGHEELENSTALLKRILNGKEKGNLFECKYENNEIKTTKTLKVEFHV